jgi:hypothetical protein
MAPLQCIPRRASPGYTEARRFRAMQDGGGSRVAGAKMSSQQLCMLPSAATVVFAPLGAECSAVLCRQRERSAFRYPRRAGFPGQTPSRTPRTILATSAGCRAKPVTRIPGQVRRREYWREKDHDQASRLDGEAKNIMDEPPAPQAGPQTANRARVGCTRFAGLSLAEGPLPMFHLRRSSTRPRRSCIYATLAKRYSYWHC